ncbi:protein DBF4 homolog B isoform X2 [Excalfactoria chinensis]|uniref:protein DBF4 homolog B isoform X2 n=1 Tax=Excalfactoria chinensis TaxID=46218 RepID=UPI003B3BB1A3
MAAPEGPLRGKSFFLDVPSGWAARELAAVIRHLGGVTESFLSKEVSYVVSSKKEAKRSRSRAEKRGNVTSEDTKAHSSAPSSSKENHTKPQQKPPDTALISRGRELLQKAMKNQDTCSGSSILANARMWGVQIVHVDEMLSYAQQLLRAASGIQKQRIEAPCPVSRAHKGKLKPPFLKVEDQSRQFRPFHHQFKSFPDLNLLAPKGSSPFEPPKNLSNSCRARAVEGSNGEKSPRSSAVPKKRKGFCECCQETFEELQKHLQSPQHRCFALDDSHYALVDRVIAQLTNSITGQLPRVLLSCLMDEHLMPQRAAGAEVLTAVLGEERQQCEQGAVGLLSADPGPDIKGCSSCLPGDGASDPTEAEELTGSCPLELPVGSRAAAAAPSEPHRLLHTPPACRKRPLCPAQPTPLGKKPRVELPAAPAPSPAFPQTRPCSTAAPRDFGVSSESDWDVPLVSTLLQDSGIRSVDKELLQRTHSSVRDSGYDSQLCLVLRRNSESDRSCSVGSRAALPPVSDLFWQLD